MPTLRQRQLAKKIVEASTKYPLPTAGEIMVSAGYSLKTSLASPGRQIALKGTQEALEEFGFDEESAKRVVQRILHKGKSERNQLSAADMIFKVQGSYAAQKTVNLNLNVPQDSDDLTEEYEAKLRARLTSHVGTTLPSSLDAEVQD